jgi:hypothetical protein
MIRKILFRAVAFAIPVLLISALTTFLYARQFQDLLNDPSLAEYLRWRWARDGVLAFLGAACAFVFVRSQLPTILAAAVAGMVFECASYFIARALGVFVRFQIEYAGTIWWFAGAALFAYAGAMATPARLESSTKVEDATGLARFIGLPLQCVLASLFLAPFLWCLSVRQFHPFMFLLAAPYASSGGFFFGLFVGAIPGQAFARIQRSSWMNRVIMPMAPGILAGVAACILAGTFMRWWTWGSTAAFISAAFQHGLLISDEVLVLCILIGMVCGPILWSLVARARHAQAVQ